MSVHTDITNLRDRTIALQKQVVELEAQSRQRDRVVAALVSIAERGGAVVLDEMYAQQAQAYVKLQAEMEVWVADRVAKGEYLVAGTVDAGRILVVRESRRDTEDAEFVAVLPEKRLITFEMLDPIDRDALIGAVVPFTHYAGPLRRVDVLEAYTVATPADAGQVA